VSGGWPKVISKLKSLLETGSTVSAGPVSHRERPLRWSASFRALISPIALTVGASKAFTRPVEIHQGGVRWLAESHLQPQVPAGDRPELKAEGASLCTIELEPFGTAVKLSIIHTIEREFSSFWPCSLARSRSLATWRT
jgi:hypothetical protein